MLASLPIADKLGDFLANPAAVILASLSLIDIAQAVAKKSWPYLLAPYTRFLKECLLLGRILRTEDFSMWRRTRERYVAIQAIQMRGSSSARTSRPVLEELRAYLRQNKPVVVLGEPGAGKTTAIRALTYQLARAALTQNVLLACAMLVASAVLASVGINWVFSLIPLASLALLEPLIRWSRIPLFIEARSEYAGGIVREWCEELIKRRLGPKPLFGWRNRHLLLIDGMNELPTYYQTFVEGWYGVLKENNWRKPMVFTSRSNESPGRQLNVNDEFQICELEDEGVERFLRAYGSELAKLEGRTYPKDREKADIAILRTRGLIAAIGSKSVARNPYWLKMLVESDALTANKGVLLLSFTKKLLVRETQEKPRGGKDAGRPTVPADLEMKALGNLAYAMHQTPEIGFNGETAQSKAYQAVAPALIGTNYSLEDVLLEGQAATLTRFSLPNWVEFQHQLVQEFFAAFSLQSRLNEITNYADNLFWWQTLIMLAGLLHHEDRDPKGDRRAKVFDVYFESILGDGSDTKRLLLAAASLQSVGEQRVDMTHRVLSKLRDNLIRKEANDNFHEIVSQLAEIAEQEVIGTLRELAADPNSKVSKAAVELIGSVSSPRAAQILIELLAHSHLQNAARDALAAMGSPAVSELVRVLRSDRAFPIGAVLRRIPAAASAVVPLLVDPDPTIRVLAAFVLGGIRDPATLPALIARFSKESRPLPDLTGLMLYQEKEYYVEPVEMVRVALADAVGEFGDPRGLESLKSLLSEDSSKVRVAAVRALGAIRDARATPWLIEFAKDQQGRDVCGSVLEALGNIADLKAIEGILAEVSSSDNAAAAWRALQSVAKRGVEHVAMLLRSPDERIRVVAAGALGRIKDPRALPLLTVAVNDDDPRVRSEAFRALGAQSTDATPILLRALRDRDLYVRNMAAIRARRIPNDVMAKALMGALDTTPEVAKTLRRFKDVAIPALAEGLKDPSARNRAVKILIDIGCSIKSERRGSAFKPIVDLLHWCETETRVAAVRVIAKVGGSFAVEPLIDVLHSSDSAVRNTAVDGLVALGPIAASGLTERLHDPDERVSQCVAEALERGLDHKVLKKLRPLLSRNEQTRFIALEAASGTATQKATAALIELALNGDRTLRDAAFSALLMMKVAAVEALMGILDDARADARGAAAWVLGQIGDQRALEKLKSLAEDNRITMFGNTVAGAAMEAIASILNASSPTRSRAVREPSRGTSGDFHSRTAKITRS